MEDASQEVQSCLDRMIHEMIEDLDRQDIVQQPTESTIDLF